MIDAGTEHFVPLEGSADVDGGYLVGAPDAESTAFSRYTQVASLPITNGMAAETSLGGLDFPGCLLSSPFVAARLNFFRYMRADVELMINVSGNKFFYGTVMVAACDRSRYDYLAAQTYQTNISFPHALMDINLPEGVSFTVPWQNPLPGMDLMAPNVGREHFRLTFWVASPITAVSSGAVVGGTSLNVYAKFTNVVLDGPLGLEITSVLDPRLGGAGAGAKAIAEGKKGGPAKAPAATSEQKGKSTAGLIGGVASSLAGAVLKVIPDPIVGVADWIAKGLGFDMPRSLEASRQVRTVLMAELGAGVGLDFSTVATYGPGHAPTKAPAVTSEADEMAIEYMAGVPSLFSRITWSPASVAGAVLESFPVNPHFMWPGGTNIFRATYCGAATLPFTYWRASMVYTAYVSASTSHCARIRFTFQAGDTGDGAGWDKREAITAVYDVNGPMVIPFTVPFIYDRPMARESIGRVYITVEAPPAPIGDAGSSNITINLYVSCAKGVQVAQPNGRYLMSPSQVTTGPAEPEGWPRDEAAALASEGNTAGYMVASVPDDGTHYPDVVTHWSVLTHAATPWFGTAGTTAGTYAVMPRCARQWIISPVTAVVLDMAGGATAATARAPLTPVTARAALVRNTTPATYLAFTVQDHLATVFNYQKGGIRIKARLEGGQDGAMTVLSSTAQLRAPACSGAGGTSFAVWEPYLAAPSGSLATRLIGEVSETTTTRLLQVEAPRTSSGTYGFCGLIPPISSARPCTSVDADAWALSTDETILVNYMGDGNPTLWRSSADDHEFFSLGMDSGRVYYVVQGVTGGIGNVAATYVMDASTQSAGTVGMSELWSSVVM